MKTKTTFKFFIAALLISLSAAKTKAQIVYVDINPDSTIYVPNVPYYVDASNSFEFNLNNDSIGDFRFDARHYSQQTSYGVILSLLKHNSNLVSGGCTNGGSREDIFFNDTISEKLNWGSSKHIRFDVNGLWYCGLPIGDIYFGLMLLNANDTLYGWVRCSATDYSITIKDYSYNTIPNSYILAGQTILGTDTLTLYNDINVYESNGVLNINLSNTIQAQGVIRLYNNAGVLIESIVINGTYNSMALTGIISGIYVVQVELPTGTVNKQIYLQGN